MKKSFKLFMATLVIGGIAFSFTSCSDKDVNDNGMEIPGDPYNKTSEEGSRLGDILGAIASLDSLPDNWQSKSFTVEPTIGRVLDESNPYVRTIASISQQEAIDIFNGFTGSELSSDATSQSWSKEGIGSFQLNTVNKDGVFATIDVNMPSVPHLTQIRFVDKSMLGENSSFKGEPYYHIGDVVKVTETKNNVDEVSYWVCVRCCNSAYDKGKTHWISFQLNKDNYKTFAAGKDVAEMVVPTKLGYSSDTPRMLKYATQLFCLLTDPEDYDDLHYEEGLGGLGKVTYPKSTIQNIARQWKEKGIADLVFPNDLTNTGNRFSPTFLNKEDTITFYCKGYSYWKNMSLYYTKVWKDRSKWAFCCKEGEDKWKPDAQKFNIKAYVSGGRRQWDGIHNPENRTAKEAFVVRYKTGGDLCKQPGSRGNNPDPTKCLPNYNKKGLKITIEDAFHYEEKGSKGFSIGDNVIDNDGAIWTCLLTPFDGYNNYVYVTMDNITTSEDLLNVTNTDLPAVEDVLKLYPLLYAYYSNQNKDNFSRVAAALCDKSQGSGIPMSMYMQGINYKGGKTLGYRTDFAIKSPDKKQRLMRMYADPCTNPQKGVIFKGFTTYQGSNKKNIYLSDVDIELDEDEIESDVIEKINWSDSLVCNFWPYKAEQPYIRDITGSGKVTDYIYERNNMFDDEHFYSIFNEPVAIIRVRILKPGDKHDFKYYSAYEDIDYNQLKSDIGKLLKTYLEAGRVFLDGASFKLSY
jgi:hypothetical protein